MRTETIRYIHDFDSRAATRIPSAGAGSSEVLVSYLRKDGEAVPLLAVHQLTVVASARRCCRTCGVMASSPAAKRRTS